MSTEKLPGLPSNNWVKHLFCKMCPSEQTSRGLEISSSRAQPLFYYFIFWLLSVGWPHQHDNEYRIQKSAYQMCQRNLQDLQHKFYSGEQSLYHTHFSLWCVTSVLNKQLKKLLDLTEREKGLTLSLNTVFENTFLYQGWHLDDCKICFMRHTEGKQYGSLSYNMVS